MGFGEAVRSCFDNYVTFSGRAARSEYWWWILFIVLAQAVIAVIDLALFGVQVVQVGDTTMEARTGPLGGLFSLATFLPGLSVMVRRLHDTGRSGWWFWIVLIPLVGWIVLLVWMIRRGDAGANAYGPDPLALR